jgi:hypothetical protein
VDHLRRDAVYFPAVHQAWQPLGIARVEEIIDVRCADETRGCPISRSMRATLAACVTSTWTSITILGCDRPVAITSFRGGFGHVGGASRG